MTKLLILTFILFSFTAFCQEKSYLPNKTLKDSVFSKGDIIKIPKLLYNLSHPMSSAVYDSLQPVIDFLIKYPNLQIEIGCHTDSRGTTDMNNKLSEFRAQHVWEYLVKEKGLDPKRLTYKGYGESRLIIQDDEILKAKTKEEKEGLHQLNRRTELVVTDIP